MIRATVLYTKPDDPDEFVDYYRRVHVPLAEALPDLVEFTWGLSQAGAGGQEPPYFLMAELRWNSPEELQAAMSSPQGVAVAEDVPKMPPGAAVTLFVSDIR